MANIFITGATGFLGWNLARQLLKGRDARLYLLVRGKTNKGAIERVHALIKKSYSTEARRRIFNRIEVINGDIAEKHLGIKKSQLHKLHSQINMIYHCAAVCEFNMPLRPIRKINVSGTKNMLDFALRCAKDGQFKSFHHISTVAVAGEFGGVFYESSLDVNQKFSNTYEQTKFEAEKLIEQYRDRGLSVSVYRPSIITGNSVTGEVSSFQMLYQPLHIFSLEIFEEIPANKAAKYSLVPVDYVARAIYLISSNKNNNKNYHLINPNTITLDFFLDTAISYFGFKKPNVVPGRECNLKGLKGIKKRLLGAYLPYLNHKKIVFDTRNFDQAIDGKGFSWPVTDKKLLLRLFKYCADTNYIKRHR